MVKKKWVDDYELFGVLPRLASNECVAVYVNAVLCSRSRVNNCTEV